MIKSSFVTLLSGIFAVYVILIFELQENETMKIAAFNIRVFGKSKVSKDHVVDTLVQIVQRYDIVLIQEIRDSSGTAIRTLLDEVNKRNAPVIYRMVLSERLGRTRSKEQYAFFYRADMDIQIIDEFQYEDPDDAFEREPLAVKVRAPVSSVVEEFALVGIHIDPDDAVQEVNKLRHVHEAVKERFNTENILIMGDLNAGGSYISKREMAKLELRQEGFHWLISDKEDTTVADTNCAYDRFILTGDDFLSAVVEGSAKVFRFDLEYGLSQEQANEVSDHYPIELELKASDSVAVELEGDTEPEPHDKTQQEPSLISDIIDALIFAIRKNCCCGSPQTDD